MNSACRVFLVKKALPFFSIIALAYAFFSGINGADDWGMQYYRPSFFDGFYRRALIGTLLYPFGRLRFDDTFINVIKFTVTVLLLAFACIKLFRKQEKDDTLYI